MDVLNGTEFHFDVRVIVAILVAFACSTIGKSIDLVGHGLFDRRLQPSSRGLTRGLVSMMHMVCAWAFVFRMHCNSCSSSWQRALKPDRGCEQRVIDA